MNDIIGAIIGGLVVLIGMFFFRKKIFREEDLTYKPLPKVPETELTEEKKEEIKDELKEMSAHNLAKHILSKLGIRSGNKKDRR